MKSKNILTSYKIIEQKHLIAIITLCEEMNALCLGRVFSKINCEFILCDLRFNDKISKELRVESIYFFDPLGIVIKYIDADVCEAITNHLSKLEPSLLRKEDSRSSSNASFVYLRTEEYSPEYYIAMLCNDEFLKKIQYVELRDSMKLNENNNLIINKI